MATDNVNYAEKINGLLDEMPDFVADFILTLEIQRIHRPCFNIPVIFTTFLGL